MTCTIEHHAILFALLTKAAIEASGEKGESAIAEGLIHYGHQRGARMAQNALANGDELTTLNSQAYGEWKPEYKDQMTFGLLKTSPSLQTFISKCAWCDAWKKHNLLEYGKYYCIDIDNAVYQGFNEGLTCTPLTTPMSNGGSRCDFDWGNPLSDEEVEALSKKKEELGNSCTKDFDFHTAHLLYALSSELKKKLPEANDIISKAKADFVKIFGEEYLKSIEGVDPTDFFIKDKEDCIDNWIEKHKVDIIKTATNIFENPEVAFEEKKSSKYLASFLEEQGFTITWGIGGIETAFSASWGSGKPIIGFLAEYDALAGLSQSPVPYPNPIGDAGHGCGHNLLGTGLAAAACALKASLEETGQEATLRVYGCPAEEILRGKVILAEQKLFDDLDLAISWHPFDRNRVSYDIWLAQDIKNYTFHGVSSHAAKAPDKGRSSLDAAELMNVGVNYMREHVTSDIRMHYSYVGQGQPANIVPDYTKVNYYIRASERNRLDEVSKRVDDCARGAALMTGTTVDIELTSYCKEMKVNRILSETYYHAMKAEKVPEYTDEELDFAKQISIATGNMTQDELFSDVQDLEEEPAIMFVGSDVATVSHIIPTITLCGATMCKGTQLHHWSATAQSGMSIGFKGMLYIAKCLAKGTRHLIDSPSLLEDAWVEHNKTK